MNAFRKEQKAVFVGQGLPASMNDLLLFLLGEVYQESCRDEWFDRRCNKQKSLHPKKTLRCGRK